MTILFLLPNKMKEAALIMVEILLPRVQASVAGRGRFHSKGICCFMLLFSLIFSGCGTVTVLDKNQSDMMPKSVAMSIFEKYGFKEWAEKPFVQGMGPSCGGAEKEFIEFSQIEVARSMPRINLLEFYLKNPKGSYFSCPLLFARFVNVTESQAVELTNAARALGATKIDRLRWFY